MAIRKNTKRKNQKKYSFLHRFFTPEKTLVLAIIFLLVIILGLIFVIIRLQSPHTPNILPETPKNEQHHIPKDVRKTLAKIATGSAVLRIPILMYHYIEFVQDKRDTIRQSLDIIPPIFDSQLKTLTDAGYTFITPGDITNIMNGTEVEPQKPIVLSFDDGYRDFYTDAFPILEKYHARAVAYIISGLLNKPNYMFTWQLQNIDNSGLIEIGAHTVDHPSLKGMQYQRAYGEIVDSKTALEDDLHHPVTAFAYPYGSFDLQAIDIVKSAGFTTAVSTIPGVEEDTTDQYFIYRIRPGGRTGEELLNFLQQTSFKPW